MNKLFSIEQKKIKYQLAYNLFIELWYYGPEIIRFSNGFNKLEKEKDFEQKSLEKESIKTILKTMT